MRVGIDGMLLWGDWTGIGRSMWELTKRLAADGRGHEYVLYTSLAFKGKRGLSRPHFKVRRALFSARIRTLRIMHEQLVLPWKALRDGVGLLHAPAYVMPLMSIAPVVLTVHDLIALKYPILVRRSSAAYINRFLPRSCERAQLILVPSRSVRRDLVSILDVPEEKIRVVPFGVGENFKPPRSDSEREELRSRLSLPERYVLFVGRAEPKKNIPMVMKAFFAAVMARRLPHDLVLAGPGTRGRRLRRLVRGHGIEGRVRLLGHVPDETLPALYGCADLFLFPSIVEGFGFPVLEAMACGTPCVVSKIPALREISEGAAIEVRLERLDRFREAVERVLTDGGLAESLRRKGLERAGLFSWKDTVDRTVEAYEECRARFLRGGPARRNRMRRPGGGGRP